MRCPETGKTLCKIKSSYYLAKKFFIRMSAKKVDKIYSRSISDLKKDD